MGHSIGKILSFSNPITAAYTGYKMIKDKKADSKKAQAEADAKVKAAQENSDQAERKNRSANSADLAGLQGDDAGGMPGGDLAGLGEGGVEYTLKKRKTLGGLG